MEERYQILNVKKSSDLLNEYSDAKRSEIAWVSSVAMGALILGLDIAANVVVYNVLKDNPVAVSFMPIYATLALAAGEAFSLKKFIESVKDARKIKKEIKNLNESREINFEDNDDIGVKAL